MPALPTHPPALGGSACRAGLGPGCPLAGVPAQVACMAASRPTLKGGRVRRRWSWTWRCRAARPCRSRPPRSTLRTSSPCSSVRPRGPTRRSRSRARISRCCRRRRLSHGPPPPPCPLPPARRPPVPMVVALAAAMHAARAAASLPLPLRVLLAVPCPGRRRPCSNRMAAPAIASALAAACAPRLPALRLVSLALYAQDRQAQRGQDADAGVVGLGLARRRGRRPLGRPRARAGAGPFSIPGSTHRLSANGMALITSDCGMPVIRQSEWP